MEDERKEPVFKTEEDKAAIWSSFWNTDPTRTKSFSGKGGFSGTAINPTYVKERLTNFFGPVGMGWGYKVIDEEIIKGHRGTDKNGVEGQVLIHKVLIEFWYRYKGVKSESIQAYGQTTFSGLNKYGWFTDEDAPKKAWTDAWMKAASDLGMCADVHAGRYDDNKYVAEMTEKFASDDPASTVTIFPDNGTPKKEEEKVEKDSPIPSRVAVSEKQGKFIYALFMGQGFGSKEVGEYLFDRYGVRKTNCIPRDKSVELIDALKTGSVKPKNPIKAEEVEDVPF